MLDRVVEKLTDYCEREETQALLQGRLLEPMLKYMVKRLRNYLLAMLSFLTCHLVILTWLLVRAGRIR